MFGRGLSTVHASAAREGRVPGDNSPETRNVADQARTFDREQRSRLGATRSIPTRIGPVAKGDFGAFVLTCIADREGSFAAYIHTVSYSCVYTWIYPPCCTTLGSQLRGCSCSLPPSLHLITSDNMDGLTVRCIGPRVL